MRFSISRKIPGPDLEAALPKRYSGLTDATTRRRRQLTLLAFPDDHVVTSADAARALKRLEGKGDDVVAFMGDATTEALASLRGAGARVFTLRSFGWTDARYAAIRHPPSHERDRGPGGRPK